MIFLFNWLISRGSSRSSLGVFQDFGDFPEDAWETFQVGVDLFLRPIKRMVFCWVPRFDNLWKPYLRDY